MRAIAAVDENWGIGREGHLLIRIPGDQRNFRELTMGGAVILGRKTLQTFPQGAPLKGRTNIILTRNPEFTVRGDNAVIVHGEEELDAALEGFAREDIWVIGGESVYRMLLPRCDEAILTRIERSYVADAWFPKLSEDPDWRLVSESEEQVCFDTTYRFETWRRQNAQ